MLNSHNIRILKSELKNSHKIALKLKNSMPNQKKNLIKIVRNNKSTNKTERKVIIKRKDILTNIRIEIKDPMKQKITNINSIRTKKELQEISTKKKDIGRKSQKNKNLTNTLKIIQKSLLEENLILINQNNLAVMSKQNRKSM